MLEWISVTNLGCFGQPEVGVPLKPLTVITGPNGAGKSTILTAIQMMRYATLQNQPGWGQVGVPFRNFSDAVFAHDETRKITLKLKISESPNFARFDVGNSQQARNSGDQSLNQQLTALFTGQFGYVSFQRQRIVTLAGVGRPNPTTFPTLFDPTGADVVQFYLERFTDRDEKYDEAADWLTKIDPSLSKLKSPLTRQGQVSLVSTLDRGEQKFDVNFSFHGMGIQNAAILVASLLFSPKKSIILIEEPENHLHPGAIEILGDLINHVVLHEGKQVILTTHSRNLLNVYLSDVGPATKRGHQHVEMTREMFEMISVELVGGLPTVSIEDLSKGTYSGASKHLKALLG